MKELPTLIDDKGVFLVEDALTLLARLPDESVDLALWDPPYPSLEIHRERGTTTRLKQSKGSSNEWFEVITWDTFNILQREAYRVLKPNSAFFLWCDETTNDVVKSIEEIGDPRTCRRQTGERTCKSGLVYWRDWIWAKVTKDGTKLRGGSGYHGRGANERLMFFLKGKRKANFDVLDVVCFAPRPEVMTADDDKPPTPKPYEIHDLLVRAYTNPGDLVLDCFAGTGVTGLAALKNDRKFLLCDTEPKWAYPELQAFVRRDRIAGHPEVEGVT